VRHEEGHQPEIHVFRAADDPSELIKRHKGEILVDVGAANLWAMRQAVNMADRIVVPVTPSQADVWSTQRFLGIVGEALKDGHSPEIWGFINRADTHSSVRETAETEKALAMLPGLLVQKVRLGQRTAFRRSFSEGLAVFELERTGKAAQEFNRLAELLFPRVKKARNRKN
jgi:chromosome partitioning protein